MVKMFENENNDSMAFLRGTDLKDLILYVQSNLLEYRKTLGLPSSVSFGLELEYENLNEILVSSYIDAELDSWESGTDGTVNSGGEVRSPKLHDTVEAWKELQIICRYLKSNGATTLNKAGGHIHVGAHVLGEDNEAWLTFLKLYSVYEHVLFRFFYGDKINERCTMEEYAPPIAASIKKVIELVKRGRNLHFSFESELPDKYGAINFGHVNFVRLNHELRKNTIEFRVPNATTNEVIEQNNVNVATKMLVAAKSGEINIDFLDYKLDKEN